MLESLAQKSFASTYMRSEKESSIHTRNKTVLYGLGLARLNFAARKVTWFWVLLARHERASFRKRKAEEKMRAIWGTVHGFRKSFKTNKNSKEELELSGSEGVCM